MTASGRHPWTLAALAVCYGSLGKLADVAAISDELNARPRREYVQSTLLAIVAASLGHVDAAFQRLERACAEHDGILVYSKTPSLPTPPPDRPADRADSPLRGVPGQLVR